MEPAVGNLPVKDFPTPDLNGGTLHQRRPAPTATRTTRRPGDIPAPRGHERAVAPFPLNRLDDLVGETTRARRPRPPRTAAAAPRQRRGDRSVVRRRLGAHGSVRAALRLPGRAVRRRERGAAADRRRDPLGALARPPRGLALRCLLPARAGRADAAGAARRGGASASTFACSPGRERRCRSSTRTAARCAQACRALTGGTRISMALDARERPFHCHHEKLVVVDDETAFVGGIDLTALAGDRLDSSEHPPRDGLGWHDTAVRLEGPIVADVARHFHARWHAVASDGLPEPGATGAGRRRESRRSSCGRCPSGCTSPGETASGRSSRATCARCGRPRGSSISRASSSGRRRSPSCSPRSCAGRRATTSA